MQIPVNCVLDEREVREELRAAEREKSRVLRIKAIRKKKGEKHGKKQ